jgi:hypothetical protein
VSLIYFAVALRFILDNRDLFLYGAKFIRFFFSGLWASKMVMDIGMQVAKPIAHAITETSSDWVEIKKLDCGKND